jgi:hypothetical protein
MLIQGLTSWRRTAGDVTWMSLVGLNGHGHWIGQEMFLKSLAGLDKPVASEVLLHSVCIKDFR